MNNTDEIFQVITNGWLSFFTMLNSWMWVFAFMPVAVALFAVSSAKKKLIRNAEINMQKKDMPSQIALVEVITLQLKYLIASVLAMYIIYGTFGVVFADASDFNYTWEMLVTSPWKEFLKF